MNILAIDYRDFSIEIDLKNPGGGEDFENAFESSRKRHTPRNFETAYLFSDKVRKFEIWQPDSKKMEVADIYSVKHPVFFENIIYTVSIDFHEDVVSASIRSRLKNVAIRVRTTRGDTQFGSGDLVFINEPGEFDLIIDYVLKTEARSILFQFTIFSSKLDTKRDHPEMVKQIEGIYPRLAIDYLKRTYHHFGLQGVGDSEILWWTIFGNIFRSMLSNLKVIVNHPYRSISTGKGVKRSDKIRKAKGRLADKLSLFEGDPRKFFGVDTKVLTEDNYENRFIKYILSDVLLHYERIYKLILKDSSNERMGKAYRIQLEFAEKAIRFLLTGPAFRSVSVLREKRRFSPVLVNRPGYAELIKDWEALKMGFELQEGLYEIELKDIAYLYQIWCFFGLTELVQHITGVPPQVMKMPKIKDRTFRLTPDKNMHSRLVFQCADNINIELYQELRYTSNFDADDAGTFDGSLCPDIIFRIGKRDQPRNLYLTYLFDAKYRLAESDRYDKLEKMDVPVKDDLSQMREYKEAIHHKRKKGSGYEHSKEIMGAYVLFPGMGKAADYDRYYREVILNTNVGGFPFLPGNMTGQNLLERHLRYIITEDSAKLLEKVPPQKGRMYRSSEAFVYVDLVLASDWPLHEALITGTATSYVCRKFDQIVATGKVRYFAPYVEGRGIPCYYEITAYSIMPRKKVFPPGHPLFLDERRKCLVLHLQDKEMLDDYVQIKGMTVNRRYTQIKHLYRPKQGFINTVPEKDIKHTDRDNQAP